MTENRPPSGSAPATLSLAELAVATACTPAEIGDLISCGLIRGPTADGLFERGDVSRVRLIGSLLRSGVGLEQLAAAVAAGRLSFSFAGDLIVDPPGLTAEDHRHALLAAGLDEAFARRMQLVLGLPQSVPDRMIREDERELYGLAAAARREGVSDEAILRVLRTTTVAMRSIVAAQRDLFRQAIEEPMLAAGLSHREMLDAGAPLRLKLQRMGHRLVFLLLHRMLEEVIFENVVLRLEEALAEAGIPRASGNVETTIAFADLSEFTRLTIERGDEAAAREAARFAALVQDVATPFGGRLVKPLGDGVMLHFLLPRDAVECLAELIKAAEGLALPAIRAGVATGPLVSRDGDFFGHTVNLAARLVSAAGPNEIWATADVAAAAEGGPVTFAESAQKTLKGIERAIEVRVARIAPG